MQADLLTQGVQRMLARYPRIQAIVDDIARQQGRALLVGGAVRDMVLGKASKDIDIEVYGLTADALHDILQRYGPVDVVGKSFGVLRVHGLDVDWSLPRADSAGRKPQVMVDPHMPFEHAFARRDLTMNAMGIDIRTAELIDPFHGRRDIENRVLRVPDRHLFVQDPLRFYRVMQFIARFNMNPDEQLNEIARTMSLTDISRERIETEFNKMMLRSRTPSRGIRWLKEIGRLADILPELAATVGIPQQHEYHPEGDVFEHIMQALDAAARLRYADQEERLTCMYAVLCHDLGKVVATTIEPNGRIRSIHHARKGVPLAKKMLARIMRHKTRIARVALLVEHHMAPLTFVQTKAGDAAYKRLAYALAPQVTIELLARVAVADRRGRNGTSHEPLTGVSSDVKQFVARARALGVFTAPEEPILQGRDLLDVLTPGPVIGTLVAHAYKLQINCGITDKQRLKSLVLQRVPRQE